MIGRLPTVGCPLALSTILSWAVGSLKGWNILPRKVPGAVRASNSQSLPPVIPSLVIPVSRLSPLEAGGVGVRSEEHTSELQSHRDLHLSYTTLFRSGRLPTVGCPLALSTILSWAVGSLKGWNILPRKVPGAVRASNSQSLPPVIPSLVIPVSRLSPLEAGGVGV